MAKINDIKNIISGMALAKPSPVITYPVVEGTAALAPSVKEVIEFPAKKENTQTDKGLGAFLTTLVEGKDYGRLPGIPSPVLFKSGAQKILRHLNYHYTVALVSKTVVATDKLVAYTVLVTILTAEDKHVGQALGSANSLENKFAKSGMGADSMLVGMATKRALLEAVRTLLIRI